MFFFPGMNGFPNPGQFFQASGPSQGHGGQFDENQILVSNHNNSLKVRQPSDNMMVNGHNNKIDVWATIANAVVTGHNNKVHSSQESASSVHFE